MGMMMIRRQTTTASAMIRFILRFCLHIIRLVSRADLWNLAPWASKCGRGGVAAAADATRGRGRGGRDGRGGARLGLVGEVGRLVLKRLRLVQVLQHDVDVLLPAPDGGTGMGWRARARATAGAGAGEGRRERTHDTLDLIDLPLHVVDAGRRRARHVCGGRFRRRRGLLAPRLLGFCYLYSLTSVHESRPVHESHVAKLRASLASCWRVREHGGVPGLRAREPG